MEINQSQPIKIIKNKTIQCVQKIYYDKIIMFK